MSIFINNKKILGTEPSVNSGDLGLFAGSDDNWYAKKSDGTTSQLGGGLLTTQVVIPSADVLNLGSTPYTIIPAVVGKTIVPISAVATLDYDTTPYATRGNLSLSINNATKGIFFVIETDFLFSSSNANCILPFDSPNLNSEMLVQSEPLLASVEFGNPTAGDSDLVITVIYTLI